MKPVLLFSIFSFFISCGFAQNEIDSAATKWKDAILQDNNLTRITDLSEILNYDLSDLLKTDAEEPPLGFIGNNYQRFDIFFTSVKKDPAKNENYLVSGINRVMSNKCDFTGTITFTDAGYYIHKSDWGNYPDSVKLGILIGTYRFAEDPKQKHVGTLQGYVAVRFYTTPDHKIFYDDMNNTSDGYYNNPFVGTWKSYDGKNTKTCNWGNGRIPASGDLDHGKKEFMPDDKYKSNGWDKYPSLLNTVWWK